MSETKAGPKYPQVKVKLTNQDGNAFNILAICQRAARARGLTPEQIQEFTVEAMSGDYGHLTATCISYFRVF